MKRYNLPLTAAAVLFLFVWTTGCGNAIQSLRARDQLNKGVKDRKSTRLNSSHIQKSRMPSSA